LRLLYRGAEADLFLGEWAGRKAVYKFRKPLPYRLKELDDSIRSRRTIREAEMLHESKVARVRTPYLYYVSPDEALLVMELIEGERMKTLLDSSPEEELRRVSCEFGTSVGRLHEAGIMHGDLTTSNVIANQEGVNLIDFGLSTRTSKVEDHAVDLRLIKETLVGAHSAISKFVFEAFVEGYREVVGDARLSQVSKKLRDIERRGRYARVE
jgi:TP53 regulating kinase and related kinases